MKKPVMQRALFIAASGPKKKSEGILSGFDDEMENEREDDEENEDEYEGRSPDNLEIIANNLRGDIRSMDERYLELAQLVGEAAFDTPEEVVALMQSQMAQGGPQGISGLAAPMEMPQGGITSGMEQQEPIKMQKGGDPAAILRAAQNIPQFGMIPGLPVANVSSQGAAPGASSVEALQWLASRGQQAAPQALNQANLLTRAGQSVYGSLLNLAPTLREAGRVALGTPMGRGATALAAFGTPAILALTGGGGRGPQAPIGSLGQPASSPEMQAAIESIPLGPSTVPSGGPVVEQTPPEEVAPLVVPRPTAPVPPAPATGEGDTTAAGKIAPPRPKDFRERVEEKIDIYKEFLGDDEDLRQAQAYFLLAESMLNVAGAKGKSIPERLTVGLKGLPAGMAAIAGEAAKSEKAIKASAIQAVQEEMAQEAKTSAQLIAKLADLEAKNADINTIASYLTTSQNMQPEKAVQFARLFKAGAAKQNEAGEVVDLTGRVIYSPFRLSEGDVGYLPQNMPFVSVGTKSLTPASAKDRSTLATEMANNQSMINAIENTMQLPSFEQMVGPMAKIQSGLTSVLTPFLGADFPLTNLPKDVQKNVARELANQLVVLNARNESRPSVWEQQRVEKFVANPDLILTSTEEFFGLLNNFRIKAINRVNEIDHRLNGAPLRQLETIPLGTSKDPLQAKDAAYLSEFFRLRPSGSIYVQLPNESSPRKLTAQEYFSQIGQR